MVLILLQAGTLAFFPFRRQKWVPGILQLLIRRVLAGFIAVAAVLRVLSVEVEGKPLTGAAVFVANHPSYIDALLLLPHLPKTVCLYKAALQQSFFPRSLAENAGFISNAGGVESVRDGVDRIGQGYRILLFPEGTRTTVPPMGPWKSSYALISARAQAPVQPVFVHMTSPIFPKGIPWWKPPEYPMKAVVKFGLSIPPPSEHSARNFHREVETLFRNELLAIQTDPAVSQV